MSKLRSGYTKRKNGLLQRQFTVNGRRYTVYGANYRECESKEYLKRARINQGIVKESGITLDDYFIEWEKRRRGTVKPSTERRCFSSYSNNISPYIGSKKLSTLKRSDIFLLQSTLKERGLRESTVNLNLATLHSIIKSAYTDEMINKNICTGISALKSSGKDASETIYRALNNDELKAFFSAGENYCYIRALKLMLLCGLRAGEACALHMSDIDLENGIIHITKTVSLSKAGYVIQTPKTKTGRRDIPINEQMQKLLIEQIHLRNSDTASANRYNMQNDNVHHERIPCPDYLFPAPHSGFAVPSTLNITISRILHKLRQDGMEIEHFSSHAFRDTFATRAVEAGMKPETLQKILGHKNISMTMDLYYHLSEEKKKAEMQLISIPI